MQPLQGPLLLPALPALPVFDPDGPLMTAMSKFADIVLCNLMFVLFCLPVFTVGASLSALYTCMLQLVYEEDKDNGLIFRDFWQAFRRNFKQATVLWLICLPSLLPDYLMGTGGGRDLPLSFQG